MASKTMRAIGLRSFGKSEKLEILEVPIPSIQKPDDILVNVKAVGLNQGDTVRAMGYSRIIETLKPPIVIGMDYAGIVAAVGEGVTEFSPGDAVFGLNHQSCSTAAEYLLLTSGNIHSIEKLPTNFSFVDGGSFAASGYTAVTALLRADKEVPGGLKGKTVLVTAGLGGIGSLLLQLLKPVFGAEKVITTLSTAKVHLLSELLGEGLVDQIVDYTKEDVIKEVGLKTVDVLFDTIFISMAYLPLMKPGGHEVAFIAKSGKTLKKEWPEVWWIIEKLADLFDAQFKWRASRWGVKYDHAFTHAAKENTEAIERWAKEGKLKAVIGGVTEMDDLETVRKFYNIVGSAKGAVGKYVIKISGEAAAAVPAH